jgi:hypothetical protein
MGLKQWMSQLFGLNDPEPPDPTEIVELEVVDYARGPLVLAALEDAGVFATSEDVFNAATALSSTRILVTRADVPAALEALKHLRPGDESGDQPRS